MQGAGWSCCGIPGNRQLVLAVGRLRGHPEGPHRALLQQETLGCHRFSVEEMPICTAWEHQQMEPVWMQVPDRRPAAVAALKDTL